MDQTKETVWKQSGNKPDGNMNSKERKKRLTVICILIMLAACGLLLNETDFLGGSHASAVQYLEVTVLFFCCLCILYRLNS